MGHEYSLSPTPCEVDVEIHKLVVMADFACTGLWVPNREFVVGGGRLHTEALKMPPELKQELRDWVFYYEDLWTNQFSDLIEEKVPRFNLWGKEIAKKIKSLCPNKEVWYCHQDENYNRYSKEDSKRYCVVTRKSDDITLGISLINTVELMGVEQNCYYPVIEDLPSVGDVFIPKES